MFIYNYLKNLITKKWYATKEAALTKVQAFYACEDLTDDQFVELRMLIEEKYPEVAA